MDDYVIDGDLVFSDQSSALKFYREQYHKKKEWVGLTEEDIAILWKATPQLVGVYSYTDIAREVEAKLKEKNT